MPESPSKRVKMDTNTSDTVKTVKPETPSNKKKLLPVSVLSGFLGSGKTTLLRHILQSPDHGLRIAVIVNDMASVNIDGAYIARGQAGSSKDSSSGETVRKEKVIQMQNGCICCTLRSDLLTEIARLAWSDNSYDHVLIESSGISEPQQVAETFTAELTDAIIDAEGMETEEMEILTKVAKLGGLKAIATIDTMVTVVDAFRFFSEFDTTEFLQDRFNKEDVPEEDQRTISDLFTDQIEFANVIIINKIDSVDKETIGRVRAYVKALNPEVKIIESKFAKVDVKTMLNTGQFDFAKAIASPGWLRTLHEMTVMDVHGKKRLAPKPETLEYGIGSFVYRARRPFDPMKLYKVLEGQFILLQNEVEDADDDEEEENEDSDDESKAGSGASPDNSDVATDDGEEAKPDYSNEEILANKKASPYFRGLHRSKGFFWLATRPSQMGSWSSAGAILTIGAEMPWFCMMPEEEWMADEETYAAIKADFDGPWGDRRQEIVFIGEKLDTDALTKLLDGCLISNTEMKKWEKVMKSDKLSDEAKEEQLNELFDDGYWAEWPRFEDENGEHDHDHDHDHSRAGHKLTHKH